MYDYRKYRQTLEENLGNGYAEYMTLSERNSIFRAGMILSSLCLLMCIAASVKVFPVYDLMEADIIRNSGGIFQAMARNFLSVKLMAVHCCIAVLVLYSFFSIIFIYRSFEKTQSPEILFVVFFAASFSLEVMRLVLPLVRIYNIPSMYLLMSSRIILFCRYFGIFSLFSASIYAVGFVVQKQRNVIGIVMVTSLVIALGIPIDTQIWDSGLNMISGYTSMFRLIEIGIFFFTTISFFIAAWSRSSREFIFIGIGSVLVSLGRNILLSADTWAGPLAGLLFLAAGTWFICTNLHKIYLWL